MLIIKLILLSISGKPNSKLKSLGCFEVSLMIENEEFITNAFVVESVSMSVDIILGTDILTEGEVHINKDGVSISNRNVVQNSNVHVNNA